MVVIASYLTSRNVFFAMISFEIFKTFADNFIGVVFAVSTRAAIPALTAVGHSLGLFEGAVALTAQTQHRVGRVGTRAPIALADQKT